MAPADTGQQRLPAYCPYPSPLPQYLAPWSDEQKTDLAYALLSNMDTPSLTALLARFRPRFHIDPCAKLPAELIAQIFSHFDPITLLTCSLVSKSWRRRALDPLIWRRLYFAEGWRFNAAAVRLLEEDLARKHHQQRSHGTSASRSRPSSALKGPDASWTLQNEPIEADNDGPADSFHIPNHTPSPSQPSPGAPFNPSYIFDEKSLKLCFNWYKLFLLRHELEQSWKKGRCTGFTLPSPRHREEAHGDFVYALQHVGKWLVSGSRDMTIAVWDLDSKRRRGQPLRGHEQSVLCLQFNPDPSDDVIISGGSDRKVIIWKFSTGEMLMRIDDAHEDSVLNLAFNSRYLLTCSKDKTIKIWSRTTLRPGDPLVPKPAPANNVRISVELSDLLSGNISFIAPYFPLLTLHGHTAAVNAIQLHNDECTSASGDRSIRVWNIRTGECIRIFTGHVKGIACVQTDGRTVISGSNDCTIRVFSRKNGTQLACFGGHKSLVRTVQGYIPDAEEEDERRRKKERRENDADDGSEYADESDYDNGASDDDSSDAVSELFMQIAADVEPQAFQGPDPSRQRRRKRSSSSSVAGAASKYARIVSGSYDGSLRVWTRDKNQRWTDSLSFTVNSVLDSEDGQMVEEDWPPIIERAERVFKIQFDASRLVVGSQNPTIVGFDFGIRKDEPEVYRLFEL
ncbi:hypothetical protein KEM56_003116 [Ascosphaera pollenicola]|nr:hypothetical protein KEM56_003116 [Ascosphaera pollenicola]